MLRTYASTISNEYLLGYSWNRPSICVSVFVLFLFFVFFIYFWERALAFFAFLVCLAHYLRDLQISFFNKNFIKNMSHCTIYTFKNYFATIFSVFSFQQNKRYPNTPWVSPRLYYQLRHLLVLSDTLSFYYYYYYYYYFK